MTQLLSKLLAGGLSAAVTLIWWPRFFPVDNVETWLIRGVVWTLCFELLLHSLAPLEQSLWRSPAARRARSRAAAAGSRFAGHGRRARGAVATAAVVVPALLLVTAPAPPHDTPAKAAAVRKVTTIKRVVRVERPKPATAVTANPAARPEAPAQPSTSPAPPAGTVAVAHRQPAPAPAAKRSSQPRPKPEAPSAGTGGQQPSATVDTTPEAPATATPVREPQTGNAADSSPRSFAG